MTREDRPLRADAERNRKRLLRAAAAVFRERGLDVGVAEIAQRAGVGRGTLFRNFASKEDLIAAVVVERMNECAARGRALLDSADPEAALFAFLEEAIGRQQLDRALFDAVADTFLANPEIRTTHAEVLSVLEQLVARAQQAGAIRPDVGAFDVLIMLKGIFEAACALGQLDLGIGERQLDLVRAALSVPAAAVPLRGRRPALEDVQRAVESASADVSTLRKARQSS